MRSVGVIAVGVAPLLALFLFLPLLDCDVCTAGPNLGSLDAPCPWCDGDRIVTAKRALFEQAPAYRWCPVGASGNGHWVAPGWSCL